ncbi:MAG: enoyl-CoA hydratase/isomerase family protein [Armatimonadetes bacterium]|nr:enoyl-CoA hydratase/isomerase family protein [Armatimonadota bacterium]
MSSLILSSREGGVATITLNRPERRNALTAEMLEQLLAALDSATQDASCRAIILRGAKDDFSTGFDLTEGQDLSFSLKHGELLVKAQLTIAEASQVVIAAVHGYVLAGGGAITASCDFAIAAASAKFGYPVLKVGIVPTPGMPFLRHELKDRDFRALALSGELWDAQRALQAGLVNSVFPTMEEALAEAHRLAGLIVASSPSAVKATKSFAAHLSRGTLREEMAESLRVYQEVRKGPEATEGLKAFAEKRAPNWA